MKYFIVIGNPITHSKSPMLHQAFAKQAGIAVQYRKQLCPNETASFTALVEAFFNGGGTGANVTVPFKETAYQLCLENTQLTAYAKVAGAVNTLYLSNGKVCGHNTDGLGLVKHLQQLGWLHQDKAQDEKPVATIKKVAVIGAGGASRGIILPLVLAGVRHIDVANRTPSKAERLVTDCQQHLAGLSANIDNSSNTETIIKTDVDFSDVTLASSAITELTGHYDLIINATSIGLTSAKLPLAAQLSCTYAYDMMYGKELPFLIHFKNKGAEVSDGYGMLLHQAILSFELWTNKKIDSSCLSL